MPNLSDNLNYRMMCDPIKSIATRLRGLREVLELSEQEVADSCRLSVDEYRDMESGDADISVNVLQTIARRYGISLDVLMFGEEPKMNSYFITRAGTGVSSNGVRPISTRRWPRVSATAGPTPSS